MVKKKVKGSGGAGGRRPKRQRTQVQHYTDDIPGTFTKKKKRNRGSDDSGSSESDSEDDQSTSLQSQQQHVVQPQQQRPTDRSTKNNNNNKDNFDLDSPDDKKKKKRKLPAKAASSSNANSENAAGKTATKKDSTSPIKQQEMPAPPPPKNVMLSHTASLAPILPIATTCPLARHSLAQQYPIVFGRGLGLPREPESPDWAPVAQYDFYFPEDYKTVTVPPTMAAIVTEDPSINTSNNCATTTNSTAPVLKTGPWPVCRVITSVCPCSNGNSNNHNNNYYLAIGDSAGFVILYATGPRGVRSVTRLNTTASKREHKRQREIQAKVEQQCRHKPELLQNRSPFWATAKTPNAIQTMTWTSSLLIILTPYEVEALKLFPVGHNDKSTTSTPSSSLGTSQACEILWTLPVAPVNGPRRNGSNALLTGGEYAGSYLELLMRTHHHYHGKSMMLWNTWGVAPVAVNSKLNSSSHEDNAMEIAPVDSDENNNNNAIKDQETEDREEQDIDPNYDWPLLLLRDPQSIQAEFVKIIPFSREEEEEAPPPIPIKRSPGRPPKKKPKPKIPVKDEELLWTDAAKCHAAQWDNHNHYSSRGARLVVAYSATNTIPASEGQVQLALLVLTDDIGHKDAQEGATATSPTVAALSSIRPQYARLQTQVGVPVVGSARNVANVPEVTLQQSPKGTYTLVSGSRGIRMYQTETMTLLRVYGEHVSLHNRNMVWKSCFVLDNKLQQQLYQQQEDQMDPHSNRNIGDSNEEQDSGDVNNDDTTSKAVTVLRQNRQGFVWLEQEDAVASLLQDDKKEASSVDQTEGMHTRRRNSISRQRGMSFSSSVEDDDHVQDDEEFWLHQAWIVGIPHPFRAPKELQETLYFWQGPERLPLFTLPLPHQSGGVQSIYPLVTAASNRNQGMWSRLLVATVNGECCEIGPTMKSDFSGNMYNPGYFVIEDNVEYIEDEDELDKVMIEVQEEEEESEEEEEDIVVPGGEFMDPDIAEAIRRSLLEAQLLKTEAKKGTAADDDDDDGEQDSTFVVVKDFADDESVMLMPCEPEPFLRKGVLPDLESEAMMDIDDLTGGDKAAKDAEFASEVLSILPQSRFAQVRWEKQKVKIKAFEASTSQQPIQLGGTGDASAGAAAPFGRGKRSKAGNLEALLKASIDPRLRQFMTDRDRLWADGKASTLQEEAWDDVVELGDANGAKMSSSDGATSSSKSAVEVHALDSKDGTTLSVNLPGKSQAEKDVAMGLLGLSPVGSPRQSAGEPKMPPPHLSLPTMGDNGNKKAGTAADESLRNGLNTTKRAGGVQIAVIELKDYTGVEQQYSCTGTAGIPLAYEEWMENGDDALVFQQENGDEPTNNNKSGTNNIANTSGMEKAAAVDGEWKVIEVPETTRCTACQGRMVPHSCGKRALPIDFEALARAEKERQEQEDEEKRKMKMEKRKQAEVKRKEAKKKKKEDEKRKKKEKEEELRRIRVAEIAEARARMANIGDCLEPASNEGNESKISPVAAEPTSSKENTTPMVTVRDGIHTNQNTEPVNVARPTTAWKEQTASPPPSTSPTAVAAVAKKEHFPAGPPIDSNGICTNALAALATIAEGATPQTEILRAPKVIQSQATGVAHGVPGFGHTPGPPAPPPPSPNHGEAASTVEHRRVVHGFFSMQDAYPQHAQSSPGAEQEGQLSAARRNRILNSYHATTRGGMPGRVSAKPTIAGLPNQAHVGFGAAHSFQVGPASHPPFPSSHAATGASNASGHPKLPYFGYTMISNNFKPKVPLKNYASEAVVTANNPQHLTAPLQQLAPMAPASIARPAPQPGRSSHGFGSSLSQPASLLRPIPTSTLAATALAAPPPTHCQGTADAASAMASLLSQPRLPTSIAPALVAGQVANGTDVKFRAVHHTAAATGVLPSNATGTNPQQPSATGIVHKNP